MQILKTVSLSLLLSLAPLGNLVKSSVNPLTTNFVETPARTICLKNPAAANTTEFFSTTTVLMFEVFKPGTKEDMEKIISGLKKDANVKDCVQGAVTGDYHAVTLVLKSKKDKAWFSGVFKNAGLNTIKINNGEVVAVDKM